MYNPVLSPFDLYELVFRLIALQYGGPILPPDIALVASQDKSWSVDQLEKELCGFYICIVLIGIEMARFFRRHEFPVSCFESDCWAVLQPNQIEQRVSRSMEEMNNLRQKCLLCTNISNVYVIFAQKWEFAWAWYALS